MNQKLRAWLALIRAPNLFTAVADILAGFLYVGRGSDDAASLAVLSVSSVCLYAGGVVLNDVADAACDATERPDRPIPSGGVRRSNAAVAAALLLAAGTCLPWLCSSTAGLIALAITVTIVLYDLALKRTILAPALMGICRGLNLLLGMSLAPDLALPYILTPCASMWLYVTSVTVLARREAGRTSGIRVLAAYFGIFLGAWSLGLLLTVTPSVDVGYLCGLVILLFGVAFSATFLSSESAPETVQQAVKWLVLCIIGFDACLVWSTRGLIGAIIVSALFIPAIGLSRRLRVT